jgi:hypothetical protein
MNRYSEIVLTAKDVRGYNILMLATESGNSIMVECILDNGRVDVHATDRSGRTAVGVIPVFRNAQTILKLLVNKGGARMVDLKKNLDVDIIVRRADLETLKWMSNKSGFPDIWILANGKDDQMLRLAIENNELDKTHWIIDCEYSIVNTHLLLVALADEQEEFEFTIAKWLISNGHVNAKQELGNILGDNVYRYLDVSRLLRLVEIGQIDNIASEDDAYAIWIKDSVYTTDFLRIILPRSDPPISVRMRLLEDDDRKDFVLSGLVLRMRLPEFLNDRYDGLMEKLSPHLPKVLRHETVMLEQGSLSTDEMWETGLGDMTPERRDELLNFFEVEAAVL